MNTRLGVAVDGGNSKTDLVLFDTEGQVRAFLRGQHSSPHQLGVEGSLDVIQKLLEEARIEAKLPREDPVELANIYLAGLDFPQEEIVYADAASKRALGEKVVLGNDTFAVLRAGLERRWGVAVVCGAGINCVGVGPNRATVRFQSLGVISGDWGGGYDIGMAAISAAARSEDGRGEKTTLERRVPEYFGMDRPHQVAEGLHFGRIDFDRIHELAHIVFEEEDHDQVSQSISNKVAEECAVLARVAAQKLRLTESNGEVVLGGGIIHLGGQVLVNRIRDLLAEAGIRLPVKVTASAPIVGSALAALDRMEVGPEVCERLRNEIQARIDVLK